MRVSTAPRSCASNLSMRTCSLSQTGPNGPRYQLHDLVGVFARATATAEDATAQGTRPPRVLVSLLATA